jgi:IS5 family transposase
VPTHKPTGKHTKQEKAGMPLSAAQKAQIDPDATFTKKGAIRHHGYKDHTQIDNKNKIIRQYEDKPTQAGSNTGRDVYADSAYRSAKSEKTLKNNHLKSKIHHRAYRNKPLTDHQDRVNRTRSKTRSRIEHVFGHMNTSMGGLVIHTIGLARAKVKIGLKNLAYNMQRFAFLMTQNQSPRPRRLPT